MNAAIIDDFDPVNLTLPEIEAMQRMLTSRPARNARLDALSDISTASEMPAIFR